MASAPPVNDAPMVGAAMSDGPRAPQAVARFRMWREELKHGRESLRVAFFAHPDTPKLLREHARLVDRVVRSVWRESVNPVEWVTLSN